jgi:(p)ppGpp synthase/HD superfamily hydrolase
MIKNLPDMTILPSKAWVFAQKKHGGQLDDDSKNYFDYHVQPVAIIVEMVTSDEEIIAAAYLHDTLEDTDTTYEELKCEFGKRVADLVFEVTHVGKKDNVGYSFPNLKSRDAILIKFADRLQNLSRMDSWDEKRKQHYLNHSIFWRK